MTLETKTEWLLHGELEGKYSLESTDPRESEFVATCVRNSLLSYLSITYLLIWWFGPADTTATVSCFSEIQIGFTFLVPAHPGGPGKRAVKLVCVIWWFGKFVGLRRFWTVKSTPG